MQTLSWTSGSGVGALSTICFKIGDGVLALITLLVDWDLKWLLEHALSWFTISLFLRLTSLFSLDLDLDLDFLIKSILSSKSSTTL